MKRPYEKPAVTTHEIRFNHYGESGRGPASGPVRELAYSGAARDGAGRDLGA